MQQHRSSYDRIVYSTSLNLDFRRHIIKGLLYVMLTAIYITHTEDEVPAFTPYIVSLSHTQ